MRNFIFKYWTVLIFLWLNYGISHAETKIYTTKQVVKAPQIDGKLDDEAWNIVDWGNEFVQYEPYDGKPVSQETAFKIVYNSNNIYVGIRAYDTAPDSIVKRIARRDQFDGDFVGIQFDSYNDLRTAFIFAVNPVGVIWDGMVTNDGDNWDNSWDPIWKVKTNIDEKGWTAEMEIPLSQLRFSNEEKHIWGMQIVRNLYRKSEVSTWQHIPKDAPGWVHLFGKLQGINNIQPHRQIEILPYFVGQYEHFEKQNGNPFATGQKSKPVIGLDGKIGITNDLTLNFTVNPDFGQVEADPSVVNLTAFETYYEEKRPFFIEGKNILDYRINIGNGDFARDNLFYSRRIGRSPHYYPAVSDSEFVKMPENTRILSAVKVTGKTQKGLSVGIMESLTAHEKAEIDNAGNRTFETVEPLTNYIIARLQKDVNKGNTIYGGMLTSTHRYINNENLNFLTNDAITGGLDFMQQWKDKTYFLKVTSVFSNIRGSENSILETQTSSVHYFQRTDANYLKVDSTLTTLTGQGGSIQFGKGGNGHFNFGTFLTWRSPGLELNDVGFLKNTDWIMEIIWLQYKLWEPFSIFRSFSVNFNQWRGWDFGGTNIFNGGNINFNTQFKNYWRIGSGINLNGKSISNSGLRGGPSFLNEGGINNWFNIRTDDRKSVQFRIGSSNYWGNNNESRNKNYWIGTTMKLGQAFSIDLNPTYSHSVSEIQYVESVEINNNVRYILGKINQKTVSLSIRFNYSLTPNLSLQYYGQPFISTGKYSNFKYVNNSLSEYYNTRFHIFEPNEITKDETNGEYIITENGTNYKYTIYDPDFRFIQFRSNLVIRWEFVPGSTLFLVWSEEKTNFDDTLNLSFIDNSRDILDIYPHNVFLIKISYNFHR